MIDAAPTFDPLDPYPWFSWMRQHEPVYQHPLTQIWYIFGYHDVMQVLNPPIIPSAADPIVFSSTMPATSERRTSQDSIIFSDPPRQRAVRELLNPAFSPQMLREQYNARIVAIIDTLLNRVIDAGEMEVVADLCYEIPLLVITDLLHVPANQLVLPVLSSANRDERVFAHAGDFDLSRFARSAPNHLAFGFRGTHFCLGAPLARLEATLMMQRLIARMEQIRVPPGVPLKALTTEGMLVPGINGVQALPVTFQRR